MGGRGINEVLADRQRITPNSGVAMGPPYECHLELFILEADNHWA